MSTPIRPPAHDVPPVEVKRTSDSPALKRERLRIAAVLDAGGLLFGAITDWFGIGVTAYLSHSQKWSPEVTAGVIVALAGGTIAAKVRGHKAGSTSLMLLTAAKGAGIVGGAHRFFS